MALGLQDLTRSQIIKPKSLKGIFSFIREKYTANCVLFCFFNKVPEYVRDLFCYKLYLNLDL